MFVLDTVFVTSSVPLNGMYREVQQKPLELTHFKLKIAKLLVFQ